jgi:hypothetical protein
MKFVPCIFGPGSDPPAPSGTHPSKRIRGKSESGSRTETKRRKEARTAPSSFKNEDSYKWTDIKDKVGTHCSFFSEVRKGH